MLTGTAIEQTVGRIVSGTRFNSRRPGHPSNHVPARMIRAAQWVPAREYVQRGVFLCA